MNTFPKSKRLVNANDFKHVFDKANKTHNHPFLVLHRPGKDKQSRLGLAIAKKKIAKAHDRNRMKRIIRESFRQQQNLPAVDIVVLAHGGGEKIENTILFRQLGKIWAKLKETYAN